MRGEQVREEEEAWFPPASPVGLEPPGRAGCAGTRGAPSPGLQPNALVLVWTQSVLVGRGSMQGGR